MQIKLTFLPGVSISYVEDQSSCGSVHSGKGKGKKSGKAAKSFLGKQQKKASGKAVGEAAGAQQVDPMESCTFDEIVKKMSKGGGKEAEECSSVSICLQNSFIS